MRHDSTRAGWSQAAQYTLRSLAACLILLMTAYVGVAAQEPQPWSPPLRLTTEEEDGSIPAVVSDSAGVVHVFWGASASPNAPAAIFYSQLRDGVWSRPVDIIIAPNGQWAQNPDVVIDSQGWLHLVWDSGGTFYSRVPLSRASSPVAWLPPRQLSDARTTPALVLDAHDVLHLVYYGDPIRSPGIYYTYSADSGQTWTASVLATEARSKAYPISVRLAVDDRGALHVIWAESVDPFPPSGVYYARSTDRGQTWSQPLALADGGYHWGSIGIDGQGSIHLFWTGTAQWAGKYHTWSQDRGDTWAPVQRLWPGTMGFLGYADMALDSSGALHLVSGAGGMPYFGVQTQGEILYASWLGDHWSAATHVSALLMNGVYEQSWPQISIARGNGVHVVWTVLDHQTGEYSVWCSSTQLPAPILPAVSAPEPSLVVQSPTPTIVPTRSPPRPEPTVPTLTDTARMATTGQVEPLVLSTLAAGLFVAAIIFASYWSRSSRGNR